MTKAAETISEALAKVHAALLTDLRHLEQAIQASSTKGFAEVQDWLGAIRERIAEHFRFEEQNGYMDSVSKREPRLEGTIQLLAEEHKQLRDSLDALIERAKTAKAPDERLQKAIGKWIERIRQHELHENDLVQNAFCLDISAED